MLAHQPDPLAVRQHIAGEPVTAMPGKGLIERDTTGHLAYTVRGRAVKGPLPSCGLWEQKRLGPPVGYLRLVLYMWQTKAKVPLSRYL